MSRGQARAEQAARTRGALITAARRLFAVHGYAETGTEDIVTAAGVGTRGALYHHFTDKQQLFKAVFEAVQDDLVAQSPQEQPGPATLDSLRSGLHGYLKAAAQHLEVQQIILIDGPAVLGWEQWRALEERYGLGAIRAQLEQAMANQSIKDTPLDPLAHLLLAVVNESALYVANAADPKQASAQARTALDRLLDGLNPD
jgi:AcrR family transcriptional regulator